MTICWCRINQNTNSICAMICLTEICVRIIVREEVDILCQRHQRRSLRFWKLTVLSMSDPLDHIDVIAILKMDDWSPFHTILSLSNLGRKEAY